MYQVILYPEYNFSIKVNFFDSLRWRSLLMIALGSLLYFIYSMEHYCVGIWDIQWTKRILYSIWNTSCTTSHRRPDQWMGLSQNSFTLFPSLIFWIYHLLVNYVTHFQVFWPNINPISNMISLSAIESSFGKMIISQYLLILLFTSIFHISENLKTDSKNAILWSSSRNHSSGVCHIVMLLNYFIKLAYMITFSVNHIDVTPYLIYAPMPQSSLSFLIT